MKKIFLLLISCIAICTQSTYAAESKRTVTQNYPASKGSTLVIDSKHGDIAIEEWDKSEIDFFVEITASTSKQARAEELVNGVNINFSKSGNSVQATTELPNNFLNNFNGQFKILYTVKVPKGIHYDLHNKYGQIRMGNADGKVSIEIKYGNFYADDLLGSSNIINCGYGNITINKTDKASIDLAYGKLSVDEANELIVDSKYSSGTLGKIKTLQLSSKYEKYSIDEVNTINASIGYTTINVNKLNNSFKAIDAKYGKINISDVAHSFQNIEIDAKYTNIVINTPDNLSYHLDATARYASIILKDKSLQKTKIDNQTQSYSGNVGSSPKGKIRITSGYGSITIN